MKRCKKSRFCCNNITNGRCISDILFLLTTIEFINDIFKHWIEQRIRNTMLSRMFPLYGWHIFYCAYYRNCDYSYNI